MAHAEYYLGLAEEAEPHLKGTEQARWFAQLDREYENLRAALSFLLERARVQTETQVGQQQAERALRLCVALYWFWYNRGKLREGRSFLEHALSGSSSVATPLRAKALHVAGELAWAQEDIEQAETLCGESVALYRELGDKVGMANPLDMLGALARVRGQYVVGARQVGGGRHALPRGGRPLEQGAATPNWPASPPVRESTSGQVSCWKRVSGSTAPWAITSASAGCFTCWPGCTFSRKPIQCELTPWPSRAWRSAEREAMIGSRPTCWGC